MRILSCSGIRACRECAADGRPGFESVRRRCGNSMWTDSDHSIDGPAASAVIALACSVVSEREAGVGV
jgi:hypothetical protein